MQHHWLIVCPKSPEVWRNLPRRLREQVLPQLAFHPETLTVQRLGDWSVLVSAAANAELLGYEEPLVCATDGLLAVNGLPTLERLGQDPGVDVPRFLLERMREEGTEELFSSLGGTWNIGYSSLERVTAFSSFSGYLGCFYYDDPEVFVVGNRARSISALVHPGGEPTYDYQVLAWLPATTMIHGDRTCFEGIRKVPPGCLLSYSRGSVELRPFSQNFYGDLEFRDDGERGEFLATALDGLSRRVSWLGRRGLRGVAHCTGGKDTRAMLALLCSADQGALERVITCGSESSGDVILARQVARGLGLEQMHHVWEGDKSSRGVPVEDVIDGFLHCAFLYEGQLTPYDGSLRPAGKPPQVITYMGGGGEVYRQKTSLRGKSDEQLFAHFLSLSYPYDRLGIVAEDTKRSQHAFLRSEIEKLRALGVRNVDAKYYIDHRLSNWGCGHFQNSPGGSIPLLLDFDLCRYVFSIDEVGEEVHYAIVERFAPELLKLPFLNDRWQGCTRNRAAERGGDLHPLEVAVEKSFPWQFEFFRRYRNQLVDAVLASGSPLLEHLSLRGLKALRRRRVKDFSSAPVKMLFGAVLGACVLDGMKGYRRPAYSAGTGESSIVGNLAPALRLEGPRLVESPTPGAPARVALARAIRSPDLAERWWRIVTARLGPRAPGTCGHMGDP